jgi:hypothetical protein
MVATAFQRMWSPRTVASVVSVKSMCRPILTRVPCRSQVGPPYGVAVGGGGTAIANPLAVGAGAAAGYLPYGAIPFVPPAAMVQKNQYPQYPATITQTTNYVSTRDPPNP